jgi:serine/threonine protein kinase
MLCSSCQNPLPDEAVFCSSCGVATVKIDLHTTIKNSPDTDPSRKTPKFDPQSDPRIGLVLDSKYELVERLGQGGMGVVYRARRLHIGDEVAVKLLSHDLLREQRAIERFRREARSAAMIRHPNVVSIHDFNDGSSSGAANEAYIVMELVKGNSLRHLLESEGRLSPGRAVTFIHDICAGVGVAHRQGLLHRDLKPDNVIISPPSHDNDRETAKVVDFGLAKVREENVSALTEAGILLGTIYYMSPEQCRGEELDARADVYSLGAMLYEMLSGGPPFRSNNITGLITKHLSEPPPTFPQSLQIPPVLARICFRALAKNREERQADALVFGKELQAALTASDEYRPGIVPYDSGSGIPAPISAQGKSRLWKWMIAIAGLTVFAVALVGLGIAIKFGADRIGRSNTTARKTQTETTQKAEETNTQVTSDRAEVTDLRGSWTGTYGPTNQAATLTIKHHDGNKIDGVLEQGATRVAFNGTIESGTIRMKQSEVLSGEGWSLGEDTGTVSKDGKKMSGTGKDAYGGSLGLTYQWAFSR